MFCTSVLSWKLPLFRFSYLYVGLSFPSRESVLRSWGSWGALAWMHLFEELFHLEALSALCLLVWAGWVTFIYGLLFETLFEDSSYNDQHTVFIEEWLKKLFNFNYCSYTVLPCVFHQDTKDCKDYWTNITCWNA